MVGGGEADSLANSGSLTILADAETTANRSSYSFIGGSRSSATMSATAIASGLVGGAGDDLLNNSGTLGVTTRSDVTGTGNTTTTIGAAKSTSTVSGGGVVSGLVGNDGDDILLNSGEITLLTQGRIWSNNQATTGGFFTDSVSTSIARMTTSGVGIDAGAGTNTVMNTGVLTLQLAGESVASAVSDGNVLSDIFGIDADAKASATASANGLSATGIAAGDDGNTIWNDGTVNVTISTVGRSGARANADAFASGDGTATAVTGMSGTRAYGILAGDGDNLIVNSGSLVVLARPVGDADSDSNADGIDFFRQPDSRANASVAMNDTLAVGIRVGDGANEIVNEGIIFVTSAPQANQAETDAVGVSGALEVLGFDILTGLDAFATSTALANNAKAYGILAGDGGNVIYNSGTISAIAAPKAVANARAVGVGLDGDATAKATAKAENALAVGIQTGSGDDVIWNDGTILALSAPFADAIQSRSTGFCPIEVVLEFLGIGCGFGNNPTPTKSISGRNAIGISTGAGDDIVVNNGTITATIGGSVGSGTAVTMGSGDDTFPLLDGSSTNGKIDLGADDDTLQLSGTPFASGQILGQSGTDTVLFVGAGSFATAFFGFEQAQKIGGGTFSIPILPTMQTISVLDGTLATSGNYVMSSGSTFEAFIDGDGTFGQLDVAGYVSLGGFLLVDAGDSLFMDGASFDIVTAALVINSFASEILPDPTPLLSFSVAQLVDSVQVTANVVSFATVATLDDSSQQIVAVHLDTVLGEADGTLASVLAQIQRLPGGSDFESILGGTAVRYACAYRHLASRQSN